MHIIFGIIVIYICSNLYFIYFSVLNKFLVKLFILINVYVIIQVTIFDQCDLQAAEHFHFQQSRAGCCVFKS